MAAMKGSPYTCMFVGVERERAQALKHTLSHCFVDGDSLCSSERFQGRQWPTCLPSSFTMMVATPVAASEVCPTKSEVEVKISTQLFQKNLLHILVCINNNNILKKYGSL